MKTNNKVAIATCAAMTMLVPVANANPVARSFWAGMAGGAIGAAVGNALTAPRAVVVEQPTTYVTTTPVVNQPVVSTAVATETVVTQPVVTETVVAQPVVTETVVAQPVVRTTVVPTTTVVYDAWGRPLPPPAVIPFGHPVPFFGPRPGFHGHPGHRGPAPHGGFHGGHYARPGCRHR